MHCWATYPVGKVFYLFQNCQYLLWKSILKQNSPDIPLKKEGSARAEFTHSTYISALTLTWKLYFLNRTCIKFVPVFTHLVLANPVLQAIMYNNISNKKTTVVSNAHNVYQHIISYIRLQCRSCSTILQINYFINKTPANVACPANDTCNNNTCPAKPQILVTFKPLRSHTFMKLCIFWGMLQ